MFKLQDCCRVLLSFLITIIATSSIVLNVYAASFTQGNVLIYTKNRIYEYSLNGTRVQRVTAPTVSFAQHGITMTANNLVAINDVNKLHLYDSTLGLWSTILSNEVNAGLNSGDGKIAAYCNSVFTGDSLGISQGIIRYDLLQKKAYRDQRITSSNVSIGLDGYLYINNNKFDPVTLDNIIPAQFQLPPNDIIDRVSNKLGTQFIISSSPYHAIYRVSKTGILEAALYTANYNIKNLIDIDINNSGQIVVGNNNGVVLITNESFNSVTIVDLSNSENPTPSYVSFVSAIQGFSENKLATISNATKTVFLRTQRCMKLQAGMVAKNLNRSVAIVSQKEIINYYTALGMNTTVINDAQNSGLNYFDIDALSISSGTSSLITMPLDTPLLSTSVVTRLIMPQGWNDFIINTTNSLSSVIAVNGICPLPGDSAYTPGLTLGHSCLQLLVEDGGPNDADGLKNKHIELLTGVVNFVDTDKDGVPDNLDAFPLDPTETKDSDGDGVGDNKDAFPLDPTETKDSDGDGVGDNKDAFPFDPLKSTGIDSDGDGVVDSKDAFPFDPSETKDSDGDGVGDNKDQYPNDPLRSIITLASYYPEGKNNNWSYRNSVDVAVFKTNRIINNLDIRPLQLTNNLRLYLRSSSTGVGISGVHLSGVDTQSVTGIISTDILFHDEIPLLFSGMLVGAKNSTSNHGQINILPKLGYRAMNFKVDTTYSGIETLSVPYGNFNAHRVSFSFSVTTTSKINNSPLDISLSLDLWLGLDTGIVKYQILNSQIKNGLIANIKPSGLASDLVTATVKFDNRIRANSIRTSKKAGGGVGCTLSRNAKFDPVFILLLLLSCGYFMTRIIRQISNSRLKNC